MELVQLYEPTHNTNGEPLTHETRVAAAEWMLETHDECVVSGNEITGDPWETRLHRALVDLFHYMHRQGMTTAERVAMIESAERTYLQHMEAEQ